MTALGEGTSTATVGHSDRTLLRVAGIATLATVVVVMLLSPGEGPEHATVTGEAARAWLVESAGQADLLIGAGAMLLLAWPVALAALRALVQRRTPGTVWGDVALLGGVLVAVDWWMVAAVEGLVAAVEDVAAMTPEAAHAWYVLQKLDESFGDVGKAGQVLLLVAVGVAALRSRLVHAPVAWFGLGVAATFLVTLIASLVGLGDQTAVLFVVGVFGFVLWLLGLGVSLLVRARAAGRHARASDTPPTSA